ncbi:MAG: TRAP transporter substrate-binding protein [Minwuiales bacterium]|nr:TRAP transporter substrate-binding protein [Minwuiales bacterium]
MGLGRLLKTAAFAGIAGAVALGVTAGANAQDKKVRWKMQSTFGSKLSVIGENGPRFSKNIKRISGGSLQIKFFEPGALVPSLQGFDSVQSGAVDAVWGTAGYHVGKIPALSWFTAVPFGPAPDEMMAWLYIGGADEIYDRIYAEQGLKGVHCGIISPEASGWFREPITSPEQFKGMKMRFFGLGAQVMQKIGVNTQLLAAADIYPALERGVIDATEFSMPSIDLNLGFYQIAKNYYFPGWHQQASVLELLLNKQNFDGLSDQHQAMIEITCGDSVRHIVADGEAKQAKALAELKSKGVTIHQWPPEMLDVFRKAWEEVVAEQSAADPLFKEVHEHYTKFRADYALWREHGYLKQ